VVAVVVPTSAAVRETKLSSQSDADVEKHLKESILLEIQETAKRMELRVYEIPIAIYVDLSSQWSSRWCFDDSFDSQEKESDRESGSDVISCGIPCDDKENDVTHDDSGVDSSAHPQRTPNTHFNTNTCKVYQNRSSLSLSLSFLGTL
jgi:hypothetical protein